MKIRFWLVFLLVFAGTLPHLSASKKLSPLEAALKVSVNYGLEKFNQIEELHFTFNVQQGTTTLQRNWIWRPKEDHVTFNSDMLKHAYYRKDIQTGNKDLNIKVNSWFVNDEYWLLFPFHLAWDSDTSFSYGKSKNIAITYNKLGAHSPRDTYEFFVENNGFIKKWKFSKNGSSQATVETTWEDHAQLGPLIISLTHRNDQQYFKLWFTNVTVKTVDGHWFQPVPIK